MALRWLQQVRGRVGTQRMNAKYGRRHGSGKLKRSSSATMSNLETRPSGVPCIAQCSSQKLPEALALATQSLLSVQYLDLTYFGVSTKDWEPLEGRFSGLTETWRYRASAATHHDDTAAVVRGDGRKNAAPSFAPLGLGPSGTVVPLYGCSRGVHVLEASTCLSQCGARRFHPTADPRRGAFRAW